MKSHFRQWLRGGNPYVIHVYINKHEQHSLPNILHHDFHIIVYVLIYLRRVKASRRHFGYLVWSQKSRKNNKRNILKKFISHRTLTSRPAESALDIVYSSWTIHNLWSYLTKLVVLIRITWCCTEVYMLNESTNAMIWS